MRGWERSSWAHDVVRMAAVAPVPKQFTKHSRPRHSDEPLSDSGGEEPRKIRSYIKPNKNINTYREAMRDQRMVVRLMNGQRPISGNSKRPSTGAKPIFPIRQELHDTNSRNLDKFLPRQSTTAKNLHPTPTPTTSKSKYSETPAISVPAHTKSQRPSPSNAPPSNLNGKPGTTLRPGSTGTISRKSSEERRGGVDSHALAKEKPPVKRRDIPKPPPLPQKRPQGPSSTRLDRPQLTHQQEWKDSSPPAKKSREEARIPSPPVPVIAQGVEEEARSPTVDATPDEALKWNEHANLAYLFKRHMRIFTLATLPDEESWFLRVMEGSATDDKITTRRTKNDNAVAERSNIGCDSAKELTPKKSDTRSNVGCDSAKESTSKKSDTRSCEDVPLFMSNPVSREVPRNSSPDQCRMSSPFAPVCGASTTSTAAFDATSFSFPAFPSHELGREEIRNSSRRKSCLATVKKQAKKRISFSEELVSTYYYESDSHCVWQEDQTSAVVASEGVEYRNQRRQNFQRNAEHDSMRMDVCEGTVFNTTEGALDCQPTRSQHPFAPVVIKQEVVDDDDIVVLFSGKTEYIEELRRKAVCM